MNKKEFFAAVNLYKRQSEIVQWKNDFLPKAIAASAKEILAHSTGNDEDAMAFANELASYTKKLDWLPDSEFSKISSLIEHSAEEMAEKYGATFDDGVLEHGTKWKDHKYIRIENGRYIYPEDVNKAKEKGKFSDYNSRTITTKYNSDGTKTVTIEGHAKSASTLRKEAQQSEDKAKTYEERSKALGGLTAKDIYETNNLKAAVERTQASGMRKTANAVEGDYQKEFVQKKKDELKKETDKLAKANEERKERESGAVAKSAAETREASNGSAITAQREGEAMQAWKNVQAIKAAAKKGEGESYEKAQREGEAMDKYNRTKNIPYTDAWWNEEEKRLKAISDRQDRNFATITTETANGSKDGDANNSKGDFANKYSGVQSYKKSQNYGNYVKLGKENGLNEDEVDQIIEAAQYAFEWRYNGAINGAKKQAAKWYKDAEIRPTKNRSGSIDIDVYQNGHKIATDITIDGLEQDIESQLKRGKKSPYIQHSFDLSTKEGYYAAIAEYKRKKA